MFCAHFFALRFYAKRFFCKVGSAALPVTEPTIVLALAGVDTLSLAYAVPATVSSVTKPELDVSTAVNPLITM
jgi:hypothetical protein